MGSPASSETTTLLQGLIVFRDFGVFNAKCPGSSSSELPKRRIPKYRNADAEGHSALTLLLQGFQREGPQLLVTENAEMSNPEMSKFYPFQLLSCATSHRLNFCEPSSGSDGYWSFALDLMAQIPFPCAPPRDSTLCTYP
jgi:hypothetical protein